MNEDVKDDKEIEVVVENGENLNDDLIDASSNIEDPSVAISELQRKIKDAEERARYAEDVARNESLRAKMAYNEVEDVNLHLVNNAIESVRAENANLKARMRAALNDADHDQVAEIQEVMSINAAKLLQLENGLEAMKAQPRKQPAQSRDVLEEFKSQVSRRSAEWAEANPEYIRNPRLFQKVVAAHNMVTADDVQPDTDEYFNRIESLLGIQSNVENHSSNRQESAPAPSSRRAAASIAAPPSAPPSRGSNGMGSRPNVVRLSSDEREMARQFGMTDKEYANHKLALQKEGRLN